MPYCFGIAKAFLHMILAISLCRWSYSHTHVYRYVAMYNISTGIPSAMRRTQIKLYCEVSMGEIGKLIGLPIHKQYNGETIMLISKFKRFSKRFFSGWIRDTLTSDNLISENLISDNLIDDTYIKNNSDYLLRVCRLSL